MATRDDGRSQVALVALHGNQSIGLEPVDRTLKGIAHVEDQGGVIEVWANEEELRDLLAHQVNGAPVWSVHKDSPVQQPAAPGDENKAPAIPPNIKPENAGKQPAAPA